MCQHRSSKLHRRTQAAARFAQRPALVELGCRLALHISHGRGCGASYGYHRSGSVAASCKLTGTRAMNSTRLISLQTNMKRRSLGRERRTKRALAIAGDRDNCTPESRRHREGSGRGPAGPMTSIQEDWSHRRLSRRFRFTVGRTGRLCPAKQAYSLGK